MASFEKRKSGLWSVRFRASTATGEKQIRLSGFRTKAEASRAMIAHLAEHPSENKKIQKESLQYFKDLCALFLENAKTRVRESTYIDFSGRINNHFLPIFKNKKVQDISPAELLKWQNSIHQYSFSYQKTLRTTLSSIFKFGERYHDLPNPMKKVEPLRNTATKAEMEFWTLEEFQSFVAAINQTKYKCFFNFLYVSGCRKGEALALSPKDVDPDKNTVTINKSVSNKTKSGSYALTGTKNDASCRKIELPTWLIKDLLSISEPQQKFVFGGEDPFSTTQVDRVFTEACKKSNVKKIRIHDIRHSCASLLLSKGLSIVAVSKRLGHRDIYQTLNTYSHMMPSDEKSIISIFESMGK